MRYEAINFDKKFKLFDEQWKPKVVAEMNDYQFKIVSLEGDFIWHDHKNTDETFIVLIPFPDIDLWSLTFSDASKSCDSPPDYLQLSPVYDH